MPGISNLGNTCGIATVIQTVFAIPELKKYLLNEPETTIQKNKKHIMTKELKDVLYILDQGNNVSPGRFCRVLCDYYGYNIGEPLDITEVYSQIIDTITDEVKKPIVSKVLERDSNLNSFVIKSENAWMIQRDKLNSEWFDSTHGFIISQTHCKNCNSIYHNYELFSVLNLPIVGDSLESCLNSYFNEEMLDGSWKCDFCSSGNAGKTLKIWKTPSVITIALKRFEFVPNRGFIKTDKQVAMPTTLDLSKWVLSPLVDNSKKNLKSIGLHFGAYGGGHYVAVTKKESWQLYDDLNVSNPLSSIDQFLNTGYLYVYD